jgi:hypothetical protein
VLLGLRNFSALPLTFAVVISPITKALALFVLSIPVGPPVTRSSRHVFVGMLVA